MGVVGGCAEYTGAPYFAAAAALRAGADLAHVFCAPEAAAALKAYSPELIVHPLLVDSSAGGGGGDGNGGGNGSGSGGELEAWVKRMDALVVGPGLGRAPGVVDAARRALAVAREASLPVALDADALWLVSEDLALGAAPRTVLTPNANELGRLMAAAAPEALEALGLPRGARPSPRQAATALATALEGATVLGKGEVDVVAAVDVGMSMIDCAWRPGRFMALLCHPNLIPLRLLSHRCRRRRYGCNGRGCGLGLAAALRRAGRRAGGHAGGLSGVAPPRQRRRRRWRGATGGGGGLGRSNAHAARGGARLCEEEALHAGVGRAGGAGRRRRGNVPRCPVNLTKK